MSYLRVGPVFYPPRHRAAQVIQRGPHGHRFSRDPVLARLENPKGSGFQWWYEQMQSAGDYDGYWQPDQMIVGLMGMGELPSGWACPIKDRATMEVEISKLETAERAGGDPEAMRARAEELRECHMQLGQQRTHKSQLDRINAVQVRSLRARGRVSTRATTPQGTARVDSTPFDKGYLNAGDVADAVRDYYSPGRGGGTNPLSWIRDNWWKAALVGGAIYIGAAYAGATRVSV